MSNFVFFVFANFSFLSFLLCCHFCSLEQLVIFSFLVEEEVTCAHLFKCDVFDPSNQPCEKVFECEDLLDHHMEIHGQKVFCCQNIFGHCDNAAGCPSCLMSWPRWHSRPRKFCTVLLKRLYSLENQIWLMD